MQGTQAGPPHGPRGALQPHPHGPGPVRTVKRTVGVWGGFPGGAVMEHTQRLPPGDAHSELVTSGFPLSAPSLSESGVRYEAAALIPQIQLDPKRPRAFLVTSPVAGQASAVVAQARAKSEAQERGTRW